MRYPETPGFQRNSATSQAAAISMISKTGSASARMRELELGGEIVKSTATRKTRFGKQAKVYYLQGAWK